MRAALSNRRMHLRAASMGLSWNPTGFRYRRSRLVARFRERDPEAFGAEWPDSIPKTGTAMIETLDRGGASATTDEALMQDISRQRHDALTELYGRHRQRLRATIDGVVHEEAETDDILQEILLQIWKEANRYSPTAGKPLGWIVTIARRRAIDRLRRRQAYSRARERYGQALLQRPRNPRREAYAPFILNDLRGFLKKAMRALPPSQCEAVELA